MVLPKHTYRDWLKNVAKTVENHYHQNEVKNLEIVNNQYLVYSIKSGTSLTCGGINDSDVLLLLICPLGQLAYVPRYRIWRSILISLFVTPGHTNFMPERSMFSKKFIEIPATSL